MNRRSLVRAPSSRRHTLPSRSTRPARAGRASPRCPCCAPPRAARTRVRPGPGNGAESFCDWCLKIAWILRRSSSCDIGTSTSASVIGHSCHAPRYSQTSGACAAYARPAPCRSPPCTSGACRADRRDRPPRRRSRAGTSSSSCAHDRDVGWADRVLAHLARLIERQVEEARLRARSVPSPRCRSPPRSRG